MKVAIVTDKPRFQILPTEEGIMEDKQKRKTIKDIKEVLSKKYNCIDLIFDETLISKLKKEKVDLVFNLCNGINGDSRLSQLPAVLEFAGIPYTGSSPLGHGLAYNKIYSCKLFQGIKIPTPKFTYIYNINEVKNINITYPVIVKPKDEGSSRGIHENSLVFNEDELVKKLKNDLELYNPPIMITEYIEGREFTVGVLGNGKNVTVLPILEVDFSELPKHLNNIYSFEVKFHYGDKTIFHVPAKIKKETKKVIEKLAIKAYNILGMRDYARVDIRLRNEIPYVLEINSLPGLMKGHSDLTKMAEASKLGYEKLIMKIVDNAINRYYSDDKLNNKIV
ncbi:D-alanine--D-alanine ligase family protein [Schnuerera sp.]|uniref:D-alanine--D-alanine ligase family protein n=1 Tax=Schnuerera sp. TaxID=2794844 RepID=UPI002C599F5B|nr:ATP-grasp domain-containing protein [Schnuerera sp.]HSH37097.1 ATP-grasp domain-containing protein [Schnuerera sp.]